MSTERFDWKAYKNKTVRALASPQEIRKLQVEMLRTLLRIYAMSYKRNNKVFSIKKKKIIKKCNFYVFMACLISPSEKRFHRGDILLAKIGVFCMDSLLILKPH